MKKRVLIVVLLIVIILLLGFGIYCCLGSSGRLYFIEEAYENGIIDKEALFNIAYHFNKEKNVNDDYEFSIQEKKPKKLTGITSLKVRNTYAKFMRERYEDPQHPKSWDIEIRDYYGTYNKCVAVKLSIKYCRYDVWVEEEYFIDDIKFEHYDSFGIYICVVG